MQYRVKPPQHLDADIHLPASKSISNRALIIQALAEGHMMPTHLSDCDDTEVIVQALKDNPYEINIKAAGTAMRFMTAYLATRVGEEHLLTGTERMKHRPIHVLVDALRRLGAHIEYVEQEGFPPLRIRGQRLEGGLLEVPANISSQFISALLMIGPVLDKGLTLRLRGSLISRPYIELTLWMMREYGAQANWGDFETIRVEKQAYRARNYFIESDWSAASYWYEMMALSANADDRVRLQGLADGSKQGDSCVRYLFSLLGIKTTFEHADDPAHAAVTLTHSGHAVPRLEYDFTNSPDLAQTFIVCCALMGIPFHFRGLSTLKIKETDRIAAMKAEMRKLGYVLHDADDSELYWAGERCEPALQQGIDTYEDHRMALAFVPASLRVQGLLINQPEVVSKSYPSFWNDLQKAGFAIDSAGQPSSSNHQP